MLKVADLRRRLKRISVRVKILEEKSTREVYSNVTKRYHYITEYVVGDETGIITLVVWNKSKELKIGKTYDLRDVDVAIYNNIPRIIVKDNSIAKLSENDIAYENINIIAPSMKKKRR